MMFNLSYFRLGKITTEDSEPHATALYTLIEVCNTHTHICTHTHTCIHTQEQHVFFPFPHIQIRSVCYLTFVL